MKITAYAYDHACDPRRTSIELEFSQDEQKLVDGNGVDRAVVAGQLVCLHARLAAAGLASTQKLTGQPATLYWKAFLWVLRQVGSPIHMDTTIGDHREIIDRDEP